MSGLERENFLGRGRYFDTNEPYGKYFSYISSSMDSSPYLSCCVETFHYSLFIFYPSLTQRKKLGRWRDVKDMQLKELRKIKLYQMAPAKN
jgi:hypothetical protein